MKKHINRLSGTLSLCFLWLIFLAGCGDAATKQDGAANAGDKAAGIATESSTDRISRGQYLAMTIGSCGDCHTPKNFGSMGPVADTTRLFAGHPADGKLPPIDMNALKPGNWALMAQDATSFVGPWGVSFAANLTPDSATGIGAWSEETFINTLRTGKHLGQPAGRQILPPMPWFFLGKMTDEDLKSLYAYFQSLPPVTNRVPAPVPPNEVSKLAGK